MSSDTFHLHSNARVRAKGTIYRIDAHLNLTTPRHRSTRKTLGKACWTLTMSIDNKPLEAKQLEVASSKPPLNEALELLKQTVADALDVSGDQLIVGNFSWQED